MTRGAPNLQRPRARLSPWALLLCAGAGCTPAAPARDAPARAPDSAEAPAAASADPEAPAARPAPDAPAAAPEGGTGALDLDGGDNLDADIAELSRATKPVASDQSSELSGREVVYRVTPQGLVVEVDGLHFRPEAKGVREAQGTYAVQLTLTAESFDARQYWVSLPEEGPLSIAGKIESSAGKRQRFGDERRGDGEEVVRAGDPRKFKQRWPGKGQPKLRAGQSLTLEVGLWGMHADGERERPVRRMFEVKLTAASPPQAVVSPPTLDWGN